MGRTEARPLGFDPSQQRRALATIAGSELLVLTETADDATRGSALTLQTALGFLLTLVTIRGVPVLAAAWSWQWALPVLAGSSALEVAAMVRLRRSPLAASLAGGRG